MNNRGWSWTPDTSTSTSQVLRLQSPCPSCEHCIYNLHLLSTRVDCSFLRPCGPSFLLGVVAFLISRVAGLCLPPLHGIIFVSHAVTSMAMFSLVFGLLLCLGWYPQAFILGMFMWPPAKLSPCTCWPDLILDLVPQWSQALMIKVIQRWTLCGHPPLFCTA